MNSVESTESVELEKYFCKKCVFEPATSRLCNKPVCYHSASKTHVIDRILKLSPIHSSVIYQISEFAEFSELLFHLGKPLLKY